MKTAVIAVSFGTTYDKARELSLDAIEDDIKNEFKNITVDRAYTSSIVIKRLSERGIFVNNLTQALNKLKYYDRVIIQPTHIIPGFEYEKIINLCSEYKNVVIGRPLLYNKSDYEYLAQFINTAFGDYNGSVIMMGHGSEHSSDVAYSRLQELLNKNIYIATVEGRVKLEDILPKINLTNILLTPLMIVCGDHGNNDMSVKWRAYIEENGYRCDALLKGLGEYSYIRKIFTKRIKEML